MIFDHNQEEVCGSLGVEKLDEDVGVAFIKDVCMASKLSEVAQLIYEGIDNPTILTTVTRMVHDSIKEMMTKEN